MNKLIISFFAPFAADTDETAVNILVSGNKIFSNKESK